MQNLRLIIPFWAHFVFFTFLQFQQFTMYHMLAFWSNWDIWRGTGGGCLAVSIIAFSQLLMLLVPAHRRLIVRVQFSIDATNRACVRDVWCFDRTIKKLWNCPAVERDADWLASLLIPPKIYFSTCKTQQVAFDCSLITSCTSESGEGVHRLHTFFPVMSWCRLRLFFDLRHEIGIWLEANCLLAW